jgi:hypothetical protein
VIDDIDDAVGDDFVVVDNTGTVQALESSVKEDTPEVDLIIELLSRHLAKRANGAKQSNAQA